MSSLSGRRCSACRWRLWLRSSPRSAVAVQDVAKVELQVSVEEPPLALTEGFALKRPSE